jgi:hypothetical protein
MEKLEFKSKVINWLKENNALPNKKVRVYKYRGQWEVRFYEKPMMLENSRNSHRKMKEPTETANCTFGKHKTSFTAYSYIGEKQFGDEEEKNYFLEILKI